MAIFTYGGNSYTFPGNSGVFLCSTTAVGGGGTQSNPALLKYRAMKKLGPYRDSVVWLPLGRRGPVTELGQYLYRTIADDWSLVPWTTATSPIILPGVPDEWALVASVDPSSGCHIAVPISNVSLMGSRQTAAQAGALRRRTPIEPGSGE